MRICTPSALITVWAYSLVATARQARTAGLRVSNAKRPLGVDRAPDRGDRGPHVVVGQERLERVGRVIDDELELVDELDGREIAEHPLDARRARRGHGEHRGRGDRARTSGPLCADALARRCNNMPRATTHVEHSRPRRPSPRQIEVEVVTAIPRRRTRRTSRRRAGSEKRRSGTQPDCGARDGARGPSVSEDALVDDDARRPSSDRPTGSSPIASIAASMRVDLRPPRQREVRAELPSTGLIAEGPQSGADLAGQAAHPLVAAAHAQHEQPVALRIAERLGVAQPYRAGSAS